MFLIIYKSNEKTDRYMIGLTPLRLPAGLKHLHESMDHPVTPAAVSQLYSQHAVSIQYYHSFTVV